MLRANLRPAVPTEARGQMKPLSTMALAARAAGVMTLLLGRGHAQKTAPSSVENQSASQRLNYSWSSREPISAESVAPAVGSSIAAGVVIQALPRPAVDHQSDFAARHDSPGQTSSSPAEVPFNDLGAVAMALTAAGGAATGPAPPPQDILASGPGP